MNLLIISASMRANSQSLKISKWLDKHATTLGLVPSVLDLHEFKLPLFDDGETETSLKNDLSVMLQNADAFVFVSPEWNGMMSHGLLNMLHYAENKELAYKPVMLVGVSSGRGGTHPLDQMKLVGQKNRHYIISPENLIVSGVEQAFNDSSLDDSAPDYVLKSRADYSLRVLAELATALKGVRESGVLDLKTFRNGV